jgi:hypothetical protein
MDKYLLNVDTITFSDAQLSEAGWTKAPVVQVSQVALFIFGSISSVGVLREVESRQQGCASPIVESVVDQRLKYQVIIFTTYLVRL